MNNEREKNKNGIDSNKTGNNGKLRINVKKIFFIYEC